MKVLIKRAFIVITLVALLSFSVVGAIMQEYKSNFEFPRRYGVERVTHYDPRVNFAKIDTFVYLEPANADKGKGVGRGGYSPIYPRGTVDMRSSTWYGYPRAEAVIKTKDLPASDEINGQFEAWLVDEETGRRLSMGVFTTRFGGTGLLQYRIDNYFDPYDTVEVTLEPLFDEDITPGPVVLIGPIPAPRYFNPPPASRTMITQALVTY